MLGYQRRFISWASYLGVFAPVRASLDTRLREAPEVKELVILLLNVLRRNLSRGNNYEAQRQSQGTLEARPSMPEQVDSKSDGAIYGIVGAIDRLHRLAATIRHPSWSDNVEKVQKYSRRQPPDGFEDTIHLIIKSKFPDAPKSLQVQLAKSVIYRRNRLRYWQKHGSQTKRSKSVAVTSETGISTSYKNNNKKNKDKEREGKDKPEPSIKSGSSDRVGYTVYPRPPTVPTNSSHVECQFLTFLCSRGHVDTDIQPYACLFDDCGSFPPSFASPKPWFNHMKERHGPDWAQYIHPDFQYRCALEHDTNISFVTEDEDSLFQHLVTAHSEGFEESELHDIARRSKVAIPSSVAKCILCKEDV
ncbi:hypothetical protein F5882DRAFT_313190, partial [Hyaloscypha sp. PMI_1271]